MRRRPPRLAAAPPWCFMLGRRGALQEAEKDGEEVERKVGERKVGESRVGAGGDARREKGGVQR